MEHYAWFVMVWFAGDAFFAFRKLDRLSKTNASTEKAFAAFMAVMIPLVIALWGASGLGFFD